MRLRFMMPRRLTLRNGAATRCVTQPPQPYLDARWRDKQPVQVPDIQTYEPDSIDADPGTTG